MPKTIIEKGAEVAAHAMKDHKNKLSTVPNASARSTGATRITAMLQNVNIIPAIDYTKTAGTNKNFDSYFPWHAACIATWYKEMGLVIPTTGANTAQGWVAFFKNKKQTSTTPIIGAVVVYGTSETNKAAHHLGLVVQIKNGVITSLQVTQQFVVYSLQLVAVNTKQVLEYILPEKTPATVAKEVAEATALQKITGEFYYPDPNDETKQHIVYNQYTKSTGVRQAPWSLHCYGPLKDGMSPIPWDDKVDDYRVDSASMKKARKAFNLTRKTVPDTGIAINDPGDAPARNYSDLADSGCGVHAAAAVFRMLTGKAIYTPGYLAQIGGNFHSVNVGTDGSSAFNNDSNSLVSKCGCKLVGIINSNNQAGAFTHMKSGGFIIASGGGPSKNGTVPFSGSGHFIYFRAVVGTLSDINRCIWYVGNSYPPENSLKPYTWEQLKAAAGDGRGLKLYAISKA